MKFEKDLHIINKTKCEKNEVTRTLIGLGFKWFSPDDKYLSINVSQEEFDFMTCVNGDVWPNSDVLTHQQFMEKYGMSDLKSKVEEAKKTLGLNNHELSLKLGHQKRYITNALLDPSVKRQKNIILKINALLLRESGDLTYGFQGKALNTQVEDAVMVGKDEYNSLNKENLDLREHNANLFNENSIKDFQINQLKKEIDHKTQIAEKHADMRNKAELRVSELEKECGEKDVAIKQQLLNSGNQVYKINELELQLKTTQQKFVDVVDQKDSEIKRLQNNCNHATNQYQGKREQVVRLNEKLNKQAVIYLTIIVIISLIGIMGFAS